MQRLNLVVLSIVYLIVSASAIVAQDGKYRITSGREVISECYGYSFRVSDGWTIFPNPVPLISTASLDELSGGELIPVGKATISFLPVPVDKRVISIDEAIKLDNRAADHDSLIKKTILLPSSTEATGGVAVSFDEDPGNGEPFVHVSKLYMKFHGRVASFVLLYRKGDKKAATYERDLLATLKSFGPLYGPSGQDGGCKSSQ